MSEPESDAGLLPCPCCGGEAEAQSNGWASRDEFHATAIACRSCGLRTSYHAGGEARTRWDRRAVGVEATLIATGDLSEGVEPNDIVDADYGMLARFDSEADLQRALEGDAMIVRWAWQRSGAADAPGRPLACPEGDPEPSGGD